MNPSDIRSWCHPRCFHSAVVNMARSEVGSPIIRERMFDTSTSKHCPTQNEDTNLSSSIKTSGQDVVVLHVPIRVILADVVLCDQRNAKVYHDRRINPNTEVAKVPAENWCVDGTQCFGDLVVGEEFVERVLGEGNQKANEEGHEDPLVSTACDEELLCESSPCDGLCNESVR